MSESIHEADVAHSLKVKNRPMTFPVLIERRKSPRAEFQLISSTSTISDWAHPVIPFENPIHVEPQKAKLFLIPTTFDEEFEGDDFPRATSASDLPDISKWVASFVVSLIEVWAGRRQPAQLIGRCHRVIYLNILKSAAKQKVMPKLFNLHIQQPLDGLCEITATIRSGDRLRVLAMRVEGVDGRWLCTALDYL